MNERLSGILLHPTSFPSPHGIGDFGKEAYDFVDYLESAGQGLWQILPMGPAGYGESPYSPYSSFAGNILLIDPDDLVECGWLSPADLDIVPDFPTDYIDFEKVRKWKIPLLKKAAANFIKKNTAGTSRSSKLFHEFCGEHVYWINDFALFMAVKDFYEKKSAEDLKAGKKVITGSWNEVWEKPIRHREKTAIDEWSSRLADKIIEEKVLQFFFFSQWHSLKKYANSKHIKIIGDIPIFVAPDSADVWANRHLFHLDQDGCLKFVAGVPPDYFSVTGQRWGNPLYNWEVMKDEKFDWWVRRIEANLKLVDIIRVDHFRGFESYWEIPAKEPTAIKGRWVKAPGYEMFSEARKWLGDFPVIAEDLGMITKEVTDLRDRLGFPGMKVLQFAFEPGENGRMNSKNAFLPHNYERNFVVYTGTHDNDTTVGWYASQPDFYKDLVRRFLGRDGSDISWDLIREALSSVANIAIIPLQDLYSAGTECRMNTPSTVGCNWMWRYKSELLDGFTAARLSDLTQLYNRLPEKPILLKK